jgi:hypothetical protein
MNSDFEDDFVSVRYEWIFFFFFFFFVVMEEINGEWWWYGVAE